MPNVSPSDPRPPSRVPRRGLAALVLTATATALLFSFKTPSEMFAVGSVGSFSAGVTRDQPSRPAAPRHRATSAVRTRRQQRASDAAPAQPCRQRRSHPPPSRRRRRHHPRKRHRPPQPPAEQVVPGQVVRTPFGLVQVAATIGPSGITDVQALQLPYDRSYSAQISQIVEPMLRDEALQAQSADIDLISGATYTSTGYAMSLQSALDQAVASMSAPA